MIDESIEMGNDISQYFSTLNKNIVVVVSGDLAHTHKVVTKLNLSCLYNLTDEADVFDKAIEKWASDPFTNEKSLIDSGKIVKTYLSCGFIGFLILHGVFLGIRKSFDVKGNVLCNHHPTYYGMMAARFVITKLIN